MQEIQATKTDYLHTFVQDVINHYILKSEFSIDIHRVLLINMVGSPPSLCEFGATTLCHSFSYIT